MPKKSKSTLDYFREIEGMYDTMEDLEQAMVDLSNRNMELLPMGYNYLDMLDWVKRKNWILKENHKLRLRVK
jgi:hypothetical protein